MAIHSGEIYGKQTAAKFVMYNVLKVGKVKGQASGFNDEIVTLQNIDNPLSLFETTAQKLASSGYIRISQTPYIDLSLTIAKKRKAAKKHAIKPRRCPLTFDFLEDRADSQRPAAILPDLFN